MAARELLARQTGIPESRIQVSPQHGAHEWSRVEGVVAAEVVLHVWGLSWLLPVIRGISMAGKLSAWHVIVRPKEDLWKDTVSISHACSQSGGTESGGM